LTLNLEEAKQIVEATKTSKGKFMIGQVCRYAPGFLQAKRLIEDGFIGDLFFVESEYAHNYTSAGGVNNWRIDARREPVIGGGCHAIDLLRWIAGEALEVSAYSNHKCFKDWPVDDCTVAIYKFPNQVIGKILVSIGCVRPYTMRSVFYGTKGTVLCDNTNGEIQLSTNLIRPTMPGFMKIPVNIASHNVSAEINDFMDCIIQGKTVEASVFEGARTVAAAWAAVQSAHNGGVLTKVEHIC
jgi:predicted dehydrogenase